MNSQPLQYSRSLLDVDALQSRAIEMLQARSDEAPRPLTKEALDSLADAGFSSPSLRPSPSVTSEITQIDLDMDLPHQTSVDDSSLLSSVPSDFDEAYMASFSTAPAFSDTSSDLSDPPSRLSTPPAFRHEMGQPTPPKSKKRPATAYLSPPSSQNSSRATPCPDGQTSADDSERPSKRRRGMPPVPRDTKRLNLQKFRGPDQVAELERLVKALRTKKKIVVVAGAGISVAAGIPDFRSSDGLFRSLKSQNNLKSSGKDLFSANVYRDDQATEQFHNMVRTLHRDTSSAQPTLFHHLVARLAQENRLLRLYTQNVDGIDTALPPLKTEVPLPRKGPWPKAIQLHGGLSKMVCTKCSNLADFDPDLFDGPSAPDCAKCEEVDYDRTEVAGKRSHGVGKLRPRMVLYDESNPDEEAIGSCTKADLRRRPDCIIVVGTTLKIPGVKRIVQETCKIVRNHRDGMAVWINNDSDPPSTHITDSWDIMVRGTADQVAKHASLGRWDDPDMEFKVLSQEEIEKVEERKKAVEMQVVVESPSKSSRHINVLPTPVPSPMFKAEKKTDVAEALIQAPPKPRISGTPAWLQTVMNKKENRKENVANPARRGKSIDRVLGPVGQALPQDTKQEPITRKAAEDQKEVPVRTESEVLQEALDLFAKTALVAKAPKGGTTKPRKAAAKKQSVPAPSGQIAFPLTKKNPALQVAKPSRKKSDSLEPSKVLIPSPSSRENMQLPPVPALTRRKSKVVESEG